MCVVNFFINKSIHQTDNADQREIDSFLFSKHYCFALMILAMNGSIRLNLTMKGFRYDLPTFSLLSLARLVFPPLQSTSTVHSINLLYFALIWAESLITLIAPVDSLLIGQVIHALEATVVLGGKRFCKFLSVNDVGISAARALEALRDVAAASACDHLLLVLDVILAVEAL